MTGSDCAVCKIIRTYLLFAVPLLALVGAGAMDGSENAALWFARVEIIDILAWGSINKLHLLMHSASTLQNNDNNRMTTISK